MKNNIKKLYFVLFSCLVLGSCTKKYELVEAKITGMDARKCFCCGGSILLINNTEYLFSGLPADADFNLDNAVYPINVEVQYVKEVGNCADFNRIIIQKITKK